MTDSDLTAWQPQRADIPTSAGCYLFRDAHDKPIYVGKARNLRSRLSSYFGSPAGLHSRTQAMVAAARSVDWIVVGSESEALHLEYSLIQKHKPRYNVRYTDDKSYPYLVLDTSNEVPKAWVRRGSVTKGDRRFGPYAHAYAIREVLAELLKVFPVRTCSQGVYDRAERTGHACLNYHIDRCAGPCIGAVSKDEHRDIVNGLAAFLDGNTDSVFNRLHTEMNDAADNQNYELAARRRDQIAAAQKALEAQEVVSDRREDFDVVAIHEDEIEAAVQVLFIRSGRLAGRTGWSADKAADVTTAQLLSGFLVELYATRPEDVPPLVVVPEIPEEQAALSELLGEMRAEATGHERGPIEIRSAKRGGKAKLLETASKNAHEAFVRNRLRRGTDFNARSEALEELGRALDLPEAPLRIECYDISHLGGTDVVASMVVFEDGLPNKREYRSFKISDDRNDDYAAMREVIERRFRRHVTDAVATDKRRFAYPPQLVLIDGGKGQLAAALDGFQAVVTEHGATEALGAVRFAALAKKHEELFLPERRTSVLLDRGSESLHLVQRLRDEAHRFAITHQRRRRKRTLGSGLDDIPGVGPARRKALLAQFGSLQRIKEADAQALASVPGISGTLAERIVDALRSTSS